MPLLKKLFRFRPHPLQNHPLIDLIDEGLILLDKKGKICAANGAAVSFLDLPKRYLLGKECSEVDSPLLRHCLALLRSCQKHDCPATDSFQSDKGKKGYLEITVLSQNKKGALFLFRDKSSHQKILEMGKDFVSNASHELRTPITIIKGFAETLQDLPELSLEMLSVITEKIVRNCHRMEKLIKSLLTLADLENIPTNRFQPCDLIALVEGCRHLLLPKFPGATLELITEEKEALVWADPDILELAILNLLENGAKYSEAPARLSVLIERKEKEMMLVVQDKGMGIAEEALDHLFDRFYTVNKAHSRKLGGAGIGLSIVKTIIQKLDGTISVASKPKEGTAFTIHLPFSK